MPYIGGFDLFNFFNEKLLKEYDENITSLNYLINEQLNLERFMKWMQDSSIPKYQMIIRLVIIEVPFSEYINFIAMKASKKVF